MYPKRVPSLVGKLSIVQLFSHCHSCTVPYRDLLWPRNILQATLSRRNDICILLMCLSFFKGNIIVVWIMFPGNIAGVTFMNYTSLLGRWSGWTVSVQTAGLWEWRLRFTSCVMCGRATKTHWVGSRKDGGFYGLELYFTSLLTLSILPNLGYL